MRILKTVFYTILLLYLLLYIPLSITIYSQEAYLINFKQIDLDNHFSEDQLQLISSDIIQYYLHKDELEEFWNEKEKTHFSDVRIILNVLFLIFLCIPFFLSYLYDRRTHLISSYSTFAILIIISIFLSTTEFWFFWDHIFHEVLFSNNLWITSQNDLSMYIFPYEFFQNTTIFILSISLFTNLLFILSQYFKRKIYNND